jgi:hypothetical protein
VIGTALPVVNKRPLPLAIFSLINTIAFPVDARKRHEKGDDETVDDSSASFNRRAVRGKQGGDVRTPKPLKDRGESAPEKDLGTEPTEGKMRS